MEKEKAIRARQIKGLEEGPARLQAGMSAPSRALRHRDKANRRPGRLFHKYSRAAHLYNVAVHETASGRSIRLRTVSRPEQRLPILLDKLGLPLPNRPKNITKCSGDF